MNRLTTALVITFTLTIALSAGAAVGAAKVTANQIAKDAIRSKHIKNNAVTGKDVKESSLGVVPNAKAVGGLGQGPVATARPADNQYVPLLAGPGWSLKTGCFISGDVGFEVHRTISGPPVMIQSSTAGGYVDAVPPNNTTNLGDPVVSLTVTVFRQGAGSTIIRLSGIYDADAFGTDDCFVRGTVTVRS